MDKASILSLCIDRSSDVTKWCVDIIMEIVETIVDFERNISFIVK